MSYNISNLVFFNIARMYDLLDLKGAILIFLLDILNYSNVHLATNKQYFYIGMVASDSN